MRPLLLAAFAAFGPLMALKTPVGGPPSPQATAKPAASGVPNYTQNVAPLLRAHCVGCHQTGGGAPFRLDSLEQAKRWSTMSASVVASRRMPPWKPTEQGVFHDENRLSDAEIATLKAWDKAGNPAGPANETTACPDSPLACATPDKLLQPARPYVVAGDAEEGYRYFVLRNPYEETRWLKGVDLRPGNPRVVHHMTAYLVEGGESERLAGLNKDGQAGYTAKHGGGFRPTAILGFWAPGMKTRSFPEGTAMALPPRASIVVQVHYVPTGKGETDRWSLGLRLADGPPARPITTGVVERMKLDIPAGAAAHEEVEEETLPGATTLWALMPHAHRLAHRMAVEAFLPDGSRRRLVSISDWDPAWQSMYWFKDPQRLPKGTRVRFSISYDNSDANLRNPNQPPRIAHWGEGARDEMMLLGFLYSRD